MARITVEDCVDKFPSRFELVLVASQRTRDLYSGEKPTVDRDNDKLWFGKAGTWYDDAGDTWWHERTSTLTGSASFDGVRIACADGNIAGGKFLVYGMA